MMDACRKFLEERLKEILLEDETPAYSDGIIFFGDMPRDFLKDNDYAADCMIFQDMKKKDGAIVSRIRNEECTEYTFTKRRFSRNVLFRCFLHSKSFEELWGKTGFVGLVDQLEQKVAEADRVIADGNNNAIRVDLHDAVRPWGINDEAMERVKRRPHKAIVRVEFKGGIYTSWTVPIIPDVEITPEVS